MKNKMSTFKSTSTITQSLELRADMRDVYDGGYWAVIVKTLGNLHVTVGRFFHIQNLSNSTCMYGKFLWQTRFIEKIPPRLGYSALNVRTVFSDSNTIRDTV